MKKILLILPVLVTLFFVIGCASVNESSKEISDGLDSENEQLESQLNEIESQINPVRDQISPSEKDEQDDNGADDLNNDASDDTNDDGNDDDTNDLNETVSPGELLKVCPDEMISNQMPCACVDDDCSGCDNPPRGYYILDRKRKEVSEFDSEWVEENCDVKTQVVY